MFCLAVCLSVSVFRLAVCLSVFYQGTRRGDNGTAVVAEESSNVDTDKSSSQTQAHSDESQGQGQEKGGAASLGEKAPVLGWGTKPTFANVRNELNG